MSIIPSKCLDWWDSLDEKEKEVIYRRTHKYYANQDYNFNEKLITSLDKYNMWGR